MQLTLKSTYNLGYAICQACCLQAYSTGPNGTTHLHDLGTVYCDSKAKTVLVLFCLQLNTVAWLKCSCHMRQVK